VDFSTKAVSRTPHGGEYYLGGKSALQAHRRKEDSKPTLTVNRQYVETHPFSAQEQVIGKRKPKRGHQFLGGPEAFVLSSELSSPAREYDFCRGATKWQNLDVIGMVLRVWSNV